MRLQLVLVTTIVVRAIPDHFLGPQEERLAGAVGCLVPLETAIQETIEYCRERKAFGQSLLDNQVVHYRKVQSR